MHDPYLILISWWFTFLQSNTSSRYSLSTGSLAHRLVPLLRLPESRMQFTINEKSFSSIATESLEELGIKDGTTVEVYDSRIAKPIPEPHRQVPSPREFPPTPLTRPYQVDLSRESNRKQRRSNRRRRIAEQFSYDFEKVEGEWLAIWIIWPSFDAQLIIILFLHRLLRRCWRPLDGSDGATRQGIRRRMHSWERLALFLFLSCLQSNTTQTLIILYYVNEQLTIFVS